MQQERPSSDKTKVIIIIENPTLTEFHEGDVTASKVSGAGRLWRRVWSCSVFTILVAGALVPLTGTHGDRTEVSSCTSLPPPPQQAEGAASRTGVRSPHQDDRTLFTSLPGVGGPLTARSPTATFPDTSHPNPRSTRVFLHPCFSPSCYSFSLVFYQRVLSRSVMSDSVTPWTVVHEVPLSMGFSRPEY